MRELFYWPSAFCVVDDVMWFVYGKVALLCKYSISKEKIIFMRKIPISNISLEGLFSKLVFLNNRLFLVPCRADKLLIYDLSSDSFSSISIGNSGKNLRFSGAYLFENKLFCIPYSIKKVISIDAISLDVNIEFSFEECFPKDDVFINDSEIVDDIIYMVSPNINGIWKYDIRKRKCERIGIELFGKIDFITRVGDCYFLCSNSEKNIVVCDKQWKIIHNLWLDGRKELKILGFDDCVCIISDLHSGFTVAYDVSENRLSPIEQSELKDRCDYYSYFGGIIEKSGSRTVYFNHASASFAICGENREYKEKRIPVDQDKIRQIVQRDWILNATEPIAESNLWGLSEFISNLHNM